MNILTEKEREDVYKYWLNSSTLTNEDGLIQLAERAVLEKLAWMELPEPFGLFCGVRHDPPKTKEFWGMLNEGADNGSKCNLYTADQLRQAYAQGAASVLSAEPSGFISPHDLKMLKEGYPATVVMLLGAKRTQPLYTLKTIE